MKTKVLGILATMSLAACGGGGGGGSAAPASSAPQNVSAPTANAPASSTPPAPSNSAADLALAGRLYKGDARTPVGFDVETRPASVAGTLSTRHLKNTDFATGPQAAGSSYEICTNDMAQAIDWSERMASWGGQYSDMSEVRSDAQKFEIIRVPRADPSAMLRHRVFKCEYLDRSSTDLRVDSGSAGAMNQRPLTATELEALSEYLWQFTMFNNSDYAVESSTGSSGNGVLMHTIRMGQLERGSNGACDTVQISDWTHGMSSTDGSLTRSLTSVRSYKVKSVGGVVESCAG
jgi:hypothetical protein